MALTSDSIHVFHVDDDRDFADMAAAYLRQEDTRFKISTASSAAEGIDRLSEKEFDCVVSEYNMPGLNGVEFLQTVRDLDQDLPFILFTGKGSEEVASEAISAGVTDCLQKRSGTEQYAVLANRIMNAVEKSRAEQ